MDIVTLKQHIEDAKYQVDKYTALQQILEDRLKWTEQLEELKITYPDLEMPGDHTAPQGMGKQETGGKTKVAIYKDILLQCKRPLHLKELLSILTARGVTFSGSGSNTPEVQLRNALNSAKKHFYNLGDNIWWVDGYPVPDDEPATQAPIFNGFGNTSESHSGQSGQYEYHP